MARARATPQGALRDEVSLKESWLGYLSGTYFCCVAHATPEAIVAKDHLVDAVTGLLRAARSDDPGWRAELRSAVHELDRIERSFAPLDSVRLGGPSSRQQLIDTARWLHPTVFEG